jgi:hypothetical protein
MILVSIIGDFHSSVLPVFYNFKDEITKHVLVYDDSKRDVVSAKGVSKGIERFIQKNNLDILELNYKLDEDSMKSLDRCAKYILSLSQDATDIYINTTDGYSTLSTVLNHKLFEKDVNFIAYDMYDNQYNLLNKEGLKTFDIKNNLNIKEHFLLKGYLVESSPMIHFAKKNEKNIKKLFEKLKNEYDVFRKADENLYPKISDLRGKYQKIKNIILEMDSTFATYPIKNALFTGGFFECYIYLLVKDMDYDDIEIGMKISRWYKNSEISNEFDILVMKNNHLNMIECKYKNFIKLEELVYKYTALSNIIDEDGKMAIITKKAPKYNKDIDLDKTKGKFYKRGRLSNIFFYGAVENNVIKFQKEIKELFDI